jgi:amidase
MVHVGKERRLYRLTADTPPVCRAPSGALVIVETQDAMDGQIPAQARCVAEADSTRANPMTGPIAVEGAQPGGFVAVQILDIALDEQGWMSRSPSGLVNVVNDHLATFIPGVELPIAPMIGVLGVTPSAGEVSGKDTGLWGGNLDIKEIGPGATVYLPVQVPEAGLVFGDVHALQADGECSGTGIEIGARITMRVAALERSLCEGIHFYRQGVLSTVGAAPELGAACRQATERLAAALSRASGLDLDHSRMFLSLAADVHVGQFVCPIQTAYVSLDLRQCPWPLRLPVVQP